MQPTYLIVHNFKSIAHIELNLEKYQDKAVLIQAKNMDEQGTESNRSGKSNLMKALMWCLFGVSTIEGTTDEIIRYGEKECYVIIRFGEIEIERRLKGKVQTFFYRKNGKDCSDSNKDAESLFLQDIGLDSKNKAIIANSIYLNTATDNLINSTPGDRLKTLTEWFDLSRYDKAVEYTRSKHKEWQAALATVDSEIEQINSSQSRLEDNKKRLVQTEQEIRDLKDKEIKLRDRQKDFDNYEGLSNNLFLLEEKLQGIIRENEDTTKSKNYCNGIDITKLEKEKADFDKALSDYELKVSNLNSQIRQLKGQLTNPYTCPHCGSSLVLNGKDLTEVSAEANEQIKASITNFEQQLSALVRPTTNVEKDIREYYRVKVYADKELKDTETIRKQIDDLRTKVGSKPEDYSSKIREVTQRLMELSAIKGEVQSQITLSETIASKLPELEEGSKKLTELSRLALLWAGEKNKVGIFQELKALTFTKIITNLSLYVNNILTSHFFIQSKIRIESTSKGIEIYQLVDGEEHPVTSMSSGERARAAFALALALKQFYSTKLDVLIADETFSSLDSVGMEFVIKTMNTFKGLKFLISHVACESEYTINLEKKDGITRVR